MEETERRIRAYALKRIANVFQLEPENLALNVKFGTDLT